MRAALPALALALLAACGSDRERGPSNARTNNSNNNNSSSRCVSDWVCQNGQCACSSGDHAGDSCLDPAHCESYCETCTGTPDAGVVRDAGTASPDGGACNPNCGARLCGPDPVCGVSCGACEEGFCNAAGQCEAGGTPLCVEGTSGSCTDSQESWTGELCCVEDAEPLTR